MGLAHHILRNTFLVTLASLSVMACSSADEDAPTEQEAYVNHEESADFEVDQAGGGKFDEISPSSFDRNLVVSEKTFLDTTSFSAEDMQKFLESTPYGRRCFLADEKFSGKSAAEWIVEVAAEKEISPVMLLARMQVEKSLISKSSRPSQSSLDHALGCGCPDSRPCSAAYEGFVNQLRCSADILRKHYDGSIDGSGSWRKGNCKRTSDRYSVCPSNDATASLYAYTPWVLPNRGGNWLVWNVTRKYVIYAQNKGWYGNGTDTPESPWIGSACTDNPACESISEDAYCYAYGTDAEGAQLGFCTVPCAGLCEDQAGHAETFCVAHPDGGGLCAPKPDAENDECGSLPDTKATTKDRFVGDSGVESRSDEVCWPNPT